MRVLRVKKDRNSPVVLLKKILNITTISSIILEMVFFPSMDNFVGCIMMLVVHVLFVCFALKTKYILGSPFLFFMMFSMFAYRYLPVPATLISFRPVDYGMETPIKTFAYETMFFAVFFAVFMLSMYKISHNKGPVSFYRLIGLYNRGTEGSIWTLGLIGIVVRIVAFVKMGFSTNSITNSVTDLMYAPVVLFFPFLISQNPSKKINFKKPLLWVYIGIITILNLGTNSRYEIITPFIQIIIFCFIYAVKENIDISKILNPKKIVVCFVICFVMLNMIQSISNAMLYVRSTRINYTIVSLIKRTIYVAQNNPESIIDMIVNNHKNERSYSFGWTEDYIDNFALNRYGNIRISDEVLYLTSSFGKTEKKELRDDLKNRLVCLLPQPILTVIGSGMNKSDYQYSSGDYIYYKSGYGNSSSLGGRRVTSYLPDGLALFGWPYLIIQSAIFGVIFWLVRGFSYVDSSNCRVYSLYALLSVNSFLAMGVNGNGIYSTLSFLLRNIWEGIFVFVIVNFFARIMKRIVIIKRKKLKRINS